MIRTLQRRRLVLFGIVQIAYFLLLLSNIQVVAAASGTRIACNQCEEPDRFVRVQVISESNYLATSRPFTHPFVLSPEDWSSILRDLKVQRQAEGFLFRDPPGPVVPAFTPDDINYLSVALSQAFAQAQPHEMVVFALSRPNSYNMTEVTTGGCFVDGPSLHVVLANYQKVVTMPSTRQLLWERPLRPDAGPHYDLVAGIHQTRVRDSGAWSGLFSSAPSELSISYRAALLEEPSKAAIPQQERSSSLHEAPSSPSLEDRLRMLKRLYDQGLISDDDYRAKKEELLDRL